MIISEIPLKPNSQTLRCSIGGVKYSLTLIWRGTGYVLDIADNSGVAIACGLSIVTGSDLLAQFKHLGINGALVVLSDSDRSLVPEFADLGVNSHLCVIE